ncbi:hypothetical protein FCV25MIE_34497, partial [Fagus crenata]
MKQEDEKIDVSDIVASKKTQPFALSYSPILISLLGLLDPPSILIPIPSHHHSY